jgi:hypothetical protein
MSRAGVHVAFFAERAGLSNTQISPLTCGDATNPYWGQDRDRLLIEAVDALLDLFVQPQAAKAGPTLGTIKTRTYGPVLDAQR